jgi:DtxR family transcriptional regulator, Mn-dependent transcriptional regulator
MSKKPARQPVSKAVEDYLKVIYDLNFNEERATTNAIADRLGVTAASVTNMLKKLAENDPPLVEYQKHRGALLTEEGKNSALEVLRAHRLIEMFLQQVLGYAWDEVHSEADRLEHVVSDQFVERISAVLGNPIHDPHGDPIPDLDLSMPGSASVWLYGMREGQKAAVRRVWDRDAGLLRYLAENGLIPGAKVEVLSYTSFDETLQVRIEGRSEPLVVGPAISKKIFVDLIE